MQNKKLLQKYARLLCLRTHFENVFIFLQRCSSKATVALGWNRFNKINSNISLYKIVYTQVKGVSLYCDFLNLDLLAFGILNISHCIILRFPKYLVLCTSRYFFYLFNGTCFSRFMGAILSAASFLHILSSAIARWINSENELFQYAKTLKNGVVVQMCILASLYMTVIFEIITRKCWDKFL